MNSAPLVSVWVVAPVAALAMIAVAGHLVATEHRVRPPSRRRIRMANGWVWLITIPLIAAGVSLIAPRAQARLFALTWLAVVGLVTLSVVLAMADIVNTLRIARRARRDLVSETARSFRQAGGRRGGQVSHPDHHG